MQLQENILFADRYQLLRLLGRGGFSEVWLAEDNKTRIKVAVKIYVPGTGLDDDGIELFSREYSLVFNLNHANLLKPAHYDVYDRMPYLVMTYCERGSANKLTGKISEDEIWKIIHDVSSGLAHLHSLNPPVIHLDIKPGNILIDASGHYLISDFGISTKVRSTLRRSMSNPQSSGGGTLAYMSPERFSDNPAPIMASDIWALGATLFELMTGNPPFGDHGGLLQKGGADIPTITGSWSDNLKTLVRLCLSKETWDRPTAGKVLQLTEQPFRNEAVTPDNKAPQNRLAKNLHESKSPSKHKVGLNIFLFVSLFIIFACVAIALFQYGVNSRSDNYSKAKSYKNHNVKTKKVNTPGKTYNGESLSSPNCYMVLPGRSVTIPVAKAWAVWASDWLKSPLDNNWKVSASLVWEDYNGLVTVSLDVRIPGKNSQIRVNIASGAKGNAIVAVHVGPNGNASDPIRWSWHIWVTDYAPDNGGKTYTRNNGYRNYTLMDRNLGATTIQPRVVTTFGLMYQWGRKDPFPGAEGTNYKGSADENQVAVYGIHKPTQSDLYSVQKVIGNAPINLRNSILYPYRYYISEGEPYDWYAIKEANQNGYLWSDRSNRKTVFDPCPERWRVPAFESGRSPWHGIERKSGSWNYGWVWNELGYYPASGLRSSNSEAFGAIGSNGYYWSATPYSISYDGGYYLYFRHNSVESQSSSNRANGFPVRCVRE